jgi:PAS domain S-box-containing protein
MTDISSSTKEAWKDITAHKKAVEALQKSERIYRSLFYYANDAIFLITMQGVHLMGNQQAADMLGYERDELIGLSVKDVVVPQEYSDAKKKLSTLLSGERLPVYERTFRRKNGEVFPVEIKASLVKDSAGNPLFIQSIVRDITHRKQAEIRIHHLTRLYATLSQVNQTIVRVKDQTELFRSISKVAVDHGKFGLAWIGLLEREMGNVTPVAVHGLANDKLPFQTINLKETPFKNGLMGAAFNSGGVAYSRDIQADPNMEHWYEMATGGGFHSAAAVPFRLNGEIVGILNLYATDVEFFENEEQHNLLKEMALDISFALDNIEREKQRKQANEALRESEERYRKTLDSMLEGCQIIGFDWRYLYVNDAVALHGRQTKAELIGKTMMDVYPGIENTEMFAVLQRCMVERVPSHMENEFKYPDGSSGWFELSVQPVQEGIFILSVDITERKQAEKELHRVNRALKVLSSGNQAVIRAKDEDELLDNICRVIVEIGKYLFAWIGWAEQDEAISVRPVAHAGKEQGYLETIDATYSNGESDRCPAVSAIRKGKPVIIRNVQSGSESAPWRTEAALRGFQSVIGLPLMDNSHTIGVLMIYAGEVNVFDQYEVQLLVELANDLAYGIHTLRTRAKHISAEVQVHRQLESLAALRAIDLAITSSFDLRVIFDVLLDKVTNQLHVDAACVLLLNQHTQILEFAAGRGFRTDTLQKTSLRLGEGYAGQAALERRVIRVQHLQKRDTDLLRTEPFALEGFVTYFAVPLVAKGHMEGVLEVYHRSHLEPDQEWLHFLEALAGQAAIALDNAGLFDDLQRSNAILMLAYDTTIEGWSRALDLRDRETEGHSQRVTEMTIRLGQIIGLSEEELVHVRRGALLHDIGKMGIPDSILHKPGPLTDEEWVIMKLHPLNSYKLLSPIAYLLPALDIPYCHHEKWDGSGYPRGLKGDEIPLAARIFAIADVWDALTSDRPYRPAWSEEKALEYIRSNSGSHFDPKVVEVFLELIGEKEG